MKRLSLDEVRRLLPALDELRPVLDALIARSEPDPDRAWSRSGELSTLGERLVPPDALEGAPEALAEEARKHLERLYGAVAEAVSGLAGDDPVGACRAFLEAAALEEARGRPDRAEAYARAAHGSVRDRRDRTHAALALRRWARAAKAQGSLVEARTRYRESHEGARAMGDVQGAAEAAIGVGNVLEQQGRWEEAASWYRTALEVMEEGGLRGPERWHALLNLHIAVRSRGLLEESLPWLERAEEAASAVGDTDAEPFLENARGQLRLWSGEYSEAEVHFRRALAATGDARARTTIHLNLAEALLAQGRALEAAGEAREAEGTALRGGVIPKLPEVYRLLGRIAAHEGNDGAFVLFERALELCRERGLPALEEALTLQAYADAEDRRGEDDAARDLREQADERFRELGIAHRRHRWVDVYGPDAGESPATQPEHDDA